MAMGQKFLSFGLVATGLVLVINLASPPLNFMLNDLSISRGRPSPMRVTYNPREVIRSKVTAHNETRLSRIFRQRREHLQERCQQLDRSRAMKELPADAWISMVTVEAPGPLRVCVPAKVGSTSWQKFAERLKNTNLTGVRPATVMQVRHPFSRLTSAYRDKFLNGAPIGGYGSAWQNLTGSTTTWDFKWLHYWFPTLLSSGRVATKRQLIKLIEGDLLAFRYIIKHYQMAGKAMVLPDATETNFEAMTYNVAAHMVVNGRQVALENAAVQAYRGEHKDLMRQHGNATFTFNEFLQFVVWANDVGVLDHHWTPYTDICFPCQKDYQYILQLETVAEESQELLKDVGYPENFRLTAEHQIKGLNKFLDKSDLEYFKDVPKYLLEKVLKIYENDFDLFDYSKELS